MVIALAVFCATFFFGCVESPTGPVVKPEVGTLTVEVNVSAPAQQLVMGEVNQAVIIIKMTAENEDIKISQIPVGDITAAESAGTLKNLCLYDGDVKVAGPVQLSYKYIYAVASFSDLGIIIPRGATKSFKLKTDVSTPADGAISGSTHMFALMTDEPIVATGVSSGQPVKVTQWGPQAANPIAVYRTKILVEWASDSPSGATVGHSTQIVAKVRITNVLNPGNRAAIIKYVNVRLTTNISNTAARALAVYEDNTSIAALGVTNWVVNGDTRFDDSMTDVVIAPGASKLFIFTLDTTDANRTGDFYLDVGMGQGDIGWDDSAGNIIATVDTLPLSTKRLAY